MQRRALIAIAFRLALVAASPDTPERYFGHEVQLLSGDDGEKRLVVDGRELVRHEIIGIDEAAIVGGVGATPKTTLRFLSDGGITMRSLKSCLCRLRFFSCGGMP